MKRILISLLTIAIVGVVGVAATRAFFDDKETSTGNSFTAGAIDLNDNLSASLFNFTDMKPGDMGGDNFDITATSNPYWACIKAKIDTTPENLATEPEVSAGDSPSSNVGELQDYLSFYLWNDLNGDGQFTPSNLSLDRNLVGPLTLAQLETAGYLPLADTTAASFFSSTALEPDVLNNLGYKYCFGTWGANPATAGLSCSGTGIQNIAQTDGVTGSIEFYAVQSKNNAAFTCASMNPVAAPVIDGVISNGEYDRALSMSITNAGGGDVKAKTQGGFLYLAANIITDTTDNRTFSGFNDEFGVNLGKSTGTDTTIFKLGTTTANGRTVGTIDGYYTSFVTAGHVLKALFTSGHRVIEWKIPLSEITPAIVNGDTLSIGGATESTDGNSVVYPIGLFWGNNATYGQLLVTP